MVFTLFQLTNNTKDIFYLLFPIFKIPKFQNSWQLEILSKLPLFELDSKVALTHWDFLWLFQTKYTYRHSHPRKKLWTFLIFDISGSSLSSLLSSSLKVKFLSRYGCYKIRVFPQAEFLQIIKLIVNFPSISCTHCRLLQSLHFTCWIPLVAEVTIATLSLK